MSRLVCGRSRTIKMVDKPIICLVCVWVMKLLEQFKIVAARRRLAEKTVEAYLSWIRQFLTFSAGHGGAWRHPASLGTQDVEAFLNDLVVRRRLSVSAQNQALCALVFLYKHVLDGVIANDHLGKFMLERSRRVQRLPTVLSPDGILNWPRPRLWTS